jgi:hypothetical protein
MTPSEVVAVSDLLVNSSICKQQCKIDVWREYCVTCQRTVQEIKDSLADIVLSTR